MSVRKHRPKFDFVNNEKSVFWKCLTKEKIYLKSQLRDTENLEWNIDEFNKYFVVGGEPPRAQRRLNPRLASRLSGSRFKVRG